MTQSATHIANAILALTRPEMGDIVSNLKMQKLLYYAQGFHLAMYGCPLFEDEIRAWNYGPVVPEVYQVYKQFGNRSIDVPAEFDFGTLSETQRELLAEVYTVYGQYSALRLMEMTHEEAPWKTTPLNEVISHQVMKDFFAGLVVDGEEKN